SPGKAGALGQYDLSFGFRPPDGVALAIDAPGVSGVGFIAFDEVNARYLGALALAVGDVSISAGGGLDNRLPGGAQGYSLGGVASAAGGGVRGCGGGWLGLRPLPRRYSSGSGSHWGVSAGWWVCIGRWTCRRCRPWRGQGGWMT